MSEIVDASNEDARSASQMLSEAREAMGLSQEEVAQELYLIPSYIRLIDSDQIEQIEKQAFVRGYLRSYAKLVGLDGDDMVARFDKSKGATPQTIEIRAVTQEPVGSTNFTGPVIQTGVMGLIGLIVVVLVVWMLVSSGDEEAPVVVVTDTAEEVAEATEAELDNDTTPAAESFNGVVTATETTSTEAEAVDDLVSQGADAVNVMAATTETAAEELVDAVEGAVIDTVTDAGEETREAVDQGFSESSSDDTEDLVEQVLPTEIAEQSGKNITIERTDELILVSAGGNDELRFAFSDECWVEIEDADGNAIYGDLNRAGDELVVNGVAPFEVLFGKAPAVTMLFNGEKFDLAPHTTSVDTAKVRVP
ncbi:MAG: helix-turn-helix domain-containing protein [Pseudomonadales bacterium]